MNASQKETVQRMQADLGQKIAEQFKDHFERQNDHDNDDIQERMARKFNFTPKTDPKAEVPRDAGLVRCLRYLYKAGGHDVETAIRMARSDGQGDLAEKWQDNVNRRNYLDSVQRAAGEDTMVGGGAMVPPDFVASVIEHLGATAVVRAAGAEVLPMPRGTLTIPYEDSGTTVAYVGEAGNATEDTPDYGQLEFKARKLVGLSAISNELLMDGSPESENSIRRSLVNAIARKEDLTFITGTGLSNTPKGFLNLALAANKFDAAATSNLANTRIDTAKALNKLLANDVPMDGLAWFISPGTFQWFTTLQTTTGALAYPDFESTKKLNGIPWYMTSAIVDTAGTGSDESKIYLVNVKNGFAIADTKKMDLKLFPDASFYNGSTVISGVSTDQSALRSIARHDTGVKYRGKEIAIIEAVTWSRS